MEERYSRTLREGDRYASIREVEDGVLILNVGAAGGGDVTTQELIVGVRTLDLLMKVCGDWREQSGDRGQAL